MIGRPGNESSDQGLSNQRGAAKIHQVTAEHEGLEVEVQIRWIPTRGGLQSPKQEFIITSQLLYHD